MYRRILVPTDGSKKSRGAIEHAIGLASAFDTDLDTLYVIDTTGGLSDTGLDEFHDVLTKAGEAAINDIIAEAKAAGIESVQGSVVHGSPHREILQYVDENDIDLIVMTTHGRTGLERYLLGSVTEKVVRLADVPVLTVRISPEQFDE